MQAVSHGDVLLRIPFRYRHTAVLTEDVIGYSISVPGVRARAGTPGYYAATVISPPGFDGPGDLWCFLLTDTRPLCLLRNQPTLAAIAPSGDNPWLWTQYVTGTPFSDYVRTPIFSVQPVEIPGEHILEYRFDGWRDGVAQISERTGGRFVRDITSQPTRPLVTIAGLFSITPDPEHPDRARIVPLGPSN
ncbi:MAG: hypothetical protein EON48_18650 [Acetobacteraceae bacterium]|nr:MAG: hypothetical protein EON48_18650 [Acetobacteraceae bacterium]